MIIDTEIEKSFERYAGILGASKEQFMREALLEKLEDLEDLMIAKERLSTISKRHTMQEVEAFVS